MGNSRARELFTERMSALMAATSVDALIPKVPVLTPRDPSRLLRNGLAVVSYSAFEDFFVQRSCEALSALDPGRVPFSSLPTKLKEAATVGMVKTLGFRMAFESAGQDRRDFVQVHSGYIHSTGSTGYKLSPLTFAPSKSNVVEGDIESSLRSLLVDAPWQKLTDLAARAGYGGVGLKEVFAQLGDQRNEAAHAADADIGIAELIQLPYDLLSLALAFDAIFSQAVCVLLERGRTANPDDKPSANMYDIRIMFVDSSSERFKVRLEENRKATKKYDSLEEALKGCLPRALKERLLVVIRDAQLRPMDWRITTI